ncbi:MAG: alanine racemase [Desulfobacteraceae bacterium]|jgi:alanine racemase|nr:alanine racemase [Desulfobacteraceae bacterium]
MEFPNIWAEIDLEAIGHNVRELRRITRPGARMMAVVKADGYGHGALAVARTALTAGADMLAVARIGEGIELRQAGLKAPILVFGPTLPAFADGLVAHDLIQSVTGLEAARQLNAVARRCGRTIPIHLKVDSGMGRLGLRPRVEQHTELMSAVAEVDAIAKLGGLRLEGMYTHFAAADERDKGYATQQFDIFERFLQALQAAGIDCGLRHAANSAAIIDLPQTHLDAVRPGIALYGLYPSPDVDHERIHLKPALSLKSRLLQVKAVPAGVSVSYGMTWKAPQPTVIGTVAAGYADGIRRNLSNRGAMLVGGRRVPIVGRVCMDLIMLDLGAGSPAAAGDEVVIIGRQGEETITADEIANLLGTINYEVVFTNATRVPRRYLP